MNAFYTNARNKLMQRTRQMESILSEADIESRYTVLFEKYAFANGVEVDGPKWKEATPKLHAKSVCKGN